MGHTIIYTPLMNCRSDAGAHEERPVLHIENYEISMTQDDKRISKKSPREVLVLIV